MRLNHNESLVAISMCHHLALNKDEASKALGVLLNANNVAYPTSFAALTLIAPEQLCNSVVPKLFRYEIVSRKYFFKKIITVVFLRWTVVKCCWM